MIYRHEVSRAAALRIEYDPDALARIREEVFSSLKAPGEGVGGILLGTFDGERLQVGDFEPLPVEKGGETGALAERIRFHNSRARVTGRRVVGWYRSNTQGGSTMSPEDLAVHERHFSESWQVLLVLHPDSQGGLDARFLLKEQPAGAFVAGALLPIPEVGTRNAFSAGSQSPVARSFAAAAGAPSLPNRGDGLREPLLIPNPLPADARSPQPRRGAPVASFPRPWNGDAESAFAPSPAPEEDAGLDQEEGLRPGDLLETPRATNRRNGWRGKAVWAGLAVMAILPVGASIYLRNFYSPADRTPSSGFVRMEAVRRDGNIEVSWDRTAMAGALEGELDIQDGGVLSRVTIDRSTLAEGRFRYAYRTDVTGFKLRVVRSEGVPLEGATTFVASNATAPSTLASAKDRAIKPDRTPKDKALLESTRTGEEERRLAQERAEAERLDSERLALKAYEARVQAGPGKPSAGAGERSTAAAPPTSTSGAAIPVMDLSGHWALQAGSPSRSPAVPESVSITVTDTNGNVHGTLDASYRAGAQKEHLNFFFSGKVLNGAARFPWTSPDGRHGLIELVRVPSSPNHLEVIWFGSGDSKQVFDEIVSKN